MYQVLSGISEVAIRYVRRRPEVHLAKDGLEVIEAQSAGQRQSVLRPLVLHEHAHLCGNRRAQVHEWCRTLRDLIRNGVVEAVADRRGNVAIGLDLRPPEVLDTHLERVRPGHIGQRAGGLHHVRDVLVIAVEDRVRVVIALAAVQEVAERLLAHRDQRVELR